MPLGDRALAWSAQGPRLCVSTSPNLSQRKENGYQLWNLREYFYVSTLHQKLTTENYVYAFRY